MLSTGMMAQWQQIGMEDYLPTTGGVQVVDETIYYHPAINDGRFYASANDGTTWTPIEFAATGTSFRFERKGELEFLNVGSAQGGATKLMRHAIGSTEWETLHGTITDFRITGAGRLIANYVENGRSSIAVSDDNGEHWQVTYPVNQAIQARLIGLDAAQRPLIQSFQSDAGVEHLAEVLYTPNDGTDWLPLTELANDVSWSSSSADHSLYASNGLRIIRSVDNGLNWDVRSVDFPYTSLTGSRLFNMGGGNIYFMCFEPGATLNGNFYQSYDKGESWEAVKDGISRFLVYNMARSSKGVLYAATSNGVYRLGIEDVASVPDAEPAAQVQAYPVPTSDELRVSASGSMITELRLYDASSREVMVLPQVDRPVITLHLGNLPTGVYVLRAVTNKGISISSVVVE